MSEEENQNSEVIEMNPGASQQGEVDMTESSSNRFVNVSTIMLVNALKCIDLAARRGAYYGGELSQVGNIRDNIFIQCKDLIEEIEQQENPQEETQEENQ